MQDKPKLFSTVLMWLLAELFEPLPEVGDLDKPKLVFFFDEAHLLFDDATKAFLDSVDPDRADDPVEGRRRLLRHAGADGRPADVLAQLGNRIQHALRAFTPEDATALRKTVRDVSDVGVLRSREAADRGRHRRGGGDAPLREGRADASRAHTAARAASQMEPADDVDARRAGLAAQAKYGTRVDRESASELLAARVERRPTRRSRTDARPEEAPGRAPKPKAPSDPLTDFLGSRQGKALQREVVRGVSGC